MSDESPSGSPSVALFGKFGGILALVGILLVEPPRDMPDPAGWRLLAVTALMLCFWLT
jgi:hypothetical protein